MFQSMESVLSQFPPQPKLPRLLAPIETLPTEIIQAIFLLNPENFAFPAASLIISQKLCDYFIYSILCNTAFKPLYKPLSSASQHQREEQVQLQRQLFNLKWMNWDFFSWYLSQKTEPNSLACQDPSGHTLSAAKWTPRGRDQNPLFPGTPQILIPVPNKLLTVPLTTEKLQFIQCFLRISKASLDWSSRESLRLSTAAKYSAVATGNVEWVRYLSRTRRVCKAPSLALVKYAIIEAGCNRSVVFELMISAREWGLRRWQDEELDSWIAAELAVERGAGEGRRKKAEWVKTKLGELRGGGWPDKEKGDYEYEGDVLVVDEHGERRIFDWRRERCLF